MKYLIAIILITVSTSAHAELTCCRDGVQVVCESPYEQRVVDLAYQEYLEAERRWLETPRSYPNWPLFERVYQLTLEEYEALLESVDKCKE